MEPFNVEAKTRNELMASRSHQFIAIHIRAAKGQLAEPTLSRDERALVAQFESICRDLTRREIEEMHA